VQASAVAEKPEPFVIVLGWVLCIIEVHLQVHDCFSLITALSGPLGVMLFLLQDLKKTHNVLTDIQVRWVEPCPNENLETRHSSEQHHILILGNLILDLNDSFPPLHNKQLQTLANVIIDLRGNAANVLLFINTQLPYTAVQIFAVHSELFPFLQDQFHTSWSHAPESWIVG
jgi:hypothetical protein